MIEQVCSIALMAAHHDGRAGLRPHGHPDRHGHRRVGHRRRLRVHAGRAAPDRDPRGRPRDGRPRLHGRDARGLAPHDPHALGRLGRPLDGAREGRPLRPLPLGVLQGHADDDGARSPPSTSSTARTPSGVGGDMSSVAHQAARMVGHSAHGAGAHADARDDDPQRGGRRRARSSTTTSSTRAASCSRSPRSATTTPTSCARPTSARCAARIVGQAYLVAYKFAEQNRARDLAASRTSSGRAPRAERRRDHRAHGLAAHEAGSRRLPRGAHVATPVTSEPAARRRRPRPRCTAGASPSSTAASPSCSPPASPTSVHLVTRTVVKPVPWSSWVPLSDHARGDRARDRAARPGRLQRRRRTARTTRPCAAARSRSAATRRCSSSPTAKATGGYKFFDGASVEYQICANSKARATARSPRTSLTPNESGAITRRMAYELALTTFHYVPEVQNVAVLLPVVQKGQKARILVLTRADNKDPKSLTSALVPSGEAAQAEHRRRRPRSPRSPTR